MISGWSVSFAEIDDEVAPDGPSNAIGVFFLGTVIGADAKISRYLSCW